MNTSTQQIALITGGSRGLGRETALNLAQRGVDVIFTYQNNAAAAAEVVEQIEAQGRRAIALQLDTGASDSFAAFARSLTEALSELGSDRLDFLVNNAGGSHHALIAEAAGDDLDTLYQVHFKGVFMLTQTVLPLIRDGGAIVNISSGLTRIIYPGSAAYGAMKGAVEVFTRYLAKELGPRGIRVNVVAPGAVQTDFSGGMVRDNPEVNQAVASVTALGRPGLPSDIGPMIASLLSDDNRWINAERIEVSGGMAI
ncbi:SDR family oxidoreductase [Saccharospirillum sp. HFRX-1]|uniref:SDR family NAD(P)-dependent oxidoreductase n=1 Tax=unclassified Saccharospirillum TaxID=2633430 RepID=UPI00371D7FF2